MGKKSNRRERKAKRGSSSRATHIAKRFFEQNESTEGIQMMNVNCSTPKVSHSKLRRNISNMYMREVSSEMINTYTWDETTPPPPRRRVFNCDRPYHVKSSPSKSHIKVAFKNPMSSAKNTLVNKIKKRARKTLNPHRKLLFSARCRRKENGLESSIDDESISIVIDKNANGIGVVGSVENASQADVAHENFPLAKIHDLDSSHEHDNDSYANESNQVNDVKAIKPPLNTVDDDCIIIEDTIEEIVIQDDDDIDNNTDVRAMNLTIENNLMKNYASKIINVDKDPVYIIDSKRQNASHRRKNKKSKFLYYTNVSTVLGEDKMPAKNAVSQTNVDTNETIIILDDSDECPATPIVAVSNKNNNVDFIPLATTAIPPAPPFFQSQPPSLLPQATQKDRLLNNVTPKHKQFDNKLYSKSERKQLEAYNINTYNPNAAVSQSSKKRMILIDGSNVAIAHSRNKEFSVEGLTICINYFRSMGHDVKAIVPQFRKNPRKSTNPEQIELLYQQGFICFTPCKNIPGLSATSYDDRFVLQMATVLDAAIISNDNYRDLINENTAFKKLIENRVIGYTWCDNMFILPQDPYGKFGPKLNEILYRY